MSNLLRLDEKKTSTFVNHFKSNPDVYNSSVDVLSINNKNVHNLRNAYFHRRHNCWLLLHEILRISLDTEHCYNSECEKKVQNLIKKGYVLLVTF